MAVPSGRYCYHFNGTGSTIANTDMNQNLVNSYAYDPFGQILAQQETIQQPFKYVGRYGVMAEPNGLYYMRARYYDPNVGRFVSEDPLGFGGGDVNLYAYVRNQPINRADPYGLLVGADDAAIIGLVALSTATVAYLESPTGQAALRQIGNDIVALTQKMNDEIARIMDRLTGPQGVQYSLRASSSGCYPNARGGLNYLSAGDVWKYGETTNPNDRYSGSWLEENGLAFVPEVVGNQMEIKIAEKLKLYGYFFANGNLPPGNMIFR
jgi:RHS repeat-associated protein